MQNYEYFEISGQCRQPWSVGTLSSPRSCEAADISLHALENCDSGTLVHGDCEAKQNLQHTRMCQSITQHFISYTLNII